MSTSIDYEVNLMTADDSGIDLLHPYLSRYTSISIQQTYPSYSVALAKHATYAIESAFDTRGGGCCGSSHGGEITQEESIQHDNIEYDNTVHDNNRGGSIENNSAREGHLHTTIYLTTRISMKCF